MSVADEAELVSEIGADGLDAGARIVQRRGAIAAVTAAASLAQFKDVVPLNRERGAATDLVEAAAIPMCRPQQVAGKTANKLSPGGDTKVNSDANNGSNYSPSGGFGRHMAVSIEILSHDILSTCGFVFQKILRKPTSFLMNTQQKMKEIA